MLSLTLGTYFLSFCFLFYFIRYLNRINRSYVLMLGFLNFLGNDTSFCSRFQIQVKRVSQLLQECLAAKLKVSSIVI